MLDRADSLRLQDVALPAPTPFPAWARPKNPPDSEAEAGFLAGAGLAQASKGNCKIVELQGTVGSAPAIERKKGFEAVISNFPNM